MVDPGAPPWAQRRMIGFDTETTGVDVEGDRVVTAVLVDVQPGRPTEVLSWLIDPGVEIPQSAIDVHGITNERVREHGRPPAEAVGEILDELAARWGPEVPLVGHNPPFDLAITDREGERHCGRALEVHGPVVDTLTIDRAMWKYVRGKGMRKLVATCARYGLGELKNAHDAEADATAALRLAWAISRRYPHQVGLMSLADLHERQRGWYRAWALDFSQYLMKQVNLLERAVLADDPTQIRKHLDDEVLPTPENVAAKLSDLRHRAEDVRRSAEDWPMRPRPAASRAA